MTIKTLQTSMGKIYANFSTQRTKFTDLLLRTTYKTY